MKYSKADINQLDMIFDMYSAAIENMEKQGIHQWDQIYPDKEIIRQDILLNQMYIGEKDNKIVVCFVLNEECDEEYNNASWINPDARFCIIHRLCVNPIFQKQGIARKTMEYIEKLCKKERYDSIRLDCFTKNHYSRKLYDKSGYSIVGYAEWRKGRFELREKVL